MADSMRIDFTDVEGQKSFSLLPKGKYIVEVTDFKESTVKSQGENHGKPTVSWTFTVESTITGETHVTDPDPDANGKDMKVEDRKLWDNMTITQNSFWRLKALLEACGFDVEGEIDFDPSEVVGSRLVALVGTQAASKNKVTGDEYDARNRIVSFHELEEDTATE